MKRPRFKNPLDDDLGDVGFALFAAYFIVALLSAASYVIWVIESFSPFPFGVPMLSLPAVVFILWKGADW